MTRRGWALLAFAVMMSVLWSGALTKPRTQAPVPSLPTQAQTCPADAWAAFDTLHMEIPVTAGETWRARCVSVEVESLVGELPPTRFTVESRTKYGVWYVFEWEVLKDA